VPRGFRFPEQQMKIGVERFAVPPSAREGGNLDREQRLEAEEVTNEIDNDRWTRCGRNRPDIDRISFRSGADSISTPRGVGGELVSNFRDGRSDTGWCQRGGFIAISLRRDSCWHAQSAWHAGGSPE
jgi:hypothetical protein